MNVAELTLEVRTDYNKLLDSCIVRLFREYDRERKKLKIDKTRVFTKEYSIKTASKNNWFIFLRKKPSEKKYNGFTSISGAAVVYYRNTLGLRVFNPSHEKTLLVYNGHFFNRYNERLKLNLKDSIDVVKHYFKHNADVTYTLTNQEGGDFVIGFCRDGFELGEFQHDGAWLVNKTFVSNDMMRPDQDEVARNLFFKQQLNLALSAKNPSADKTIEGYDRDRLAARNGFNPD